MNADGVENVHSIALSDSEDEAGWGGWSPILEPPNPPDSPRLRRSIVAQAIRERFANQGSEGHPPFTFQPPTAEAFDDASLRWTYPQGSFSRPAPQGGLSFQPPERSRYSTLRWGRFADRLARVQNGVRLDADGNEISSEDEEEYERNRAQMRARAEAITSGDPITRTLLYASGMADLASSNVPPPPSATRRTSRAVLSATTQTHNEFAADEGTAARVRLNPRSMRRMLDLATPEEDTPLPPPSWPETARVFGSSEPFVASPLPLPLVRLDGNRPNSRKRAAEDTGFQPIKVSIHAHVAGR